MLLQILGTGTSQVSEKRVSSSTYLEIAGKKCLIDCGCGTLVRLSQAKISLKEIDYIFITHFHIDHISDLFALLWALKYPSLGRKKKLFLFGPKGFIDLYLTHIRPIVFEKDFDLFELHLEEMYGKKDFPGFSVAIHDTPHSYESISYKFIENDKKLVISGDTGYDAKLIDFSSNADLLVLECSHDNSKKLDNHLIPKECGEIAKKAQVKKLVLTHLYPIQKETRLQETKVIFPKTILAKDLMVFKI